MTQGWDDGMLLPSDNWFLGWGETNLGGRKPNPQARPQAGIPCCCAHPPYGAERTLLGAYTYLQSRWTPVAHSFHPADDGLWTLPEAPETANRALGRTSWRSWSWCGFFRQDLPWSWVMVWLCSAICAPFPDGFTPAKWQGQVQMISVAYWSSQAPLCPVLPIFNIRVMSFYPKPCVSLQQYLGQ